MYLIFDTETTGLPEHRLPLDHAAQPHIVQVAGLLIDTVGQEVSMFNFLIQPDGYSIPENVSKIHGITTEHAKRFGVPLPVAMSVLSNMIMRCQTIVAHNIDFDLTLYRIELARMNKPDRSLDRKHFCTGEHSKNIVRMPPSERMIKAGIGGFKMPKLIEAYKFAFNEEFANAHDALADVRACARLFFWIKKNVVTPEVVHV